MKMLNISPHGNLCDPLFLVSSPHNAGVGGGGGSGQCRKREGGLGSVGERLAGGEEHFRRKLGNKIFDSVSQGTFPKKTSCRANLFTSYEDV